MKKNMGIADRVIRTLLAIIVTILFFTNVISGVLGIILLITAGIFLVTSFVSFCPLYSIFGLRTCPMEKKLIK